MNTCVKVALFKMLEAVPMGGKFDPATRPRPTSAWAEIYPAMWATMADGGMPMTYDDFQAMTSYYRIALLNMRQGSASEETWDCLALGVNLALVLAEMGFGEEWIPRIKDAQDGLLRSRDRKAKFGTLRMDGNGLAAVSDVMDVFEEQLKVATRREVLDARDVVLERIDQQSAALDLLENA